LVLLMAVKAELENLRISLPKWRQIVDAYVIGIERGDPLREETIALVEERMHGLPGVVLEVRFGGLGAIYSRLAANAAEKFPDFDFCIRADASFAPVPSTFRKAELDPSHLAYAVRVREPDIGAAKVANIVFRNLPSAAFSGFFHERVVFRLTDRERATYVGTGSKLDGQRGMLPLISLEINENTEAGWSRRALGRWGRHERYIDGLRSDLRESAASFADSLLRLGLQHFNRATARASTLAVVNSTNHNPTGTGTSQGSSFVLTAAPSHRPTPAERTDLGAAVGYLQRYCALGSHAPGFDAALAATWKADVSGRWLALLALGQAVGMLGNVDEAVRLLDEASVLAPGSAEPGFFAGRLLLERRLPGDLERAVALLGEAAALPMAEPGREGVVRAWTPLYMCHARLAHAHALLLALDDGGGYAGRRPPCIFCNPALLRVAADRIEAESLGCRHSGVSETWSNQRIQHVQAQLRRAAAKFDASRKLHTNF
jgi:hypothetical protein